MFTQTKFEVQQNSQDLSSDTKEIICLDDVELNGVGGGFAVCGGT